MDGIRERGKRCEVAPSFFLYFTHCGPRWPTGSKKQCRALLVANTDPFTLVLCPQHSCSLAEFTDHWRGPSTLVSFWHACWRVVLTSDAFDARQYTPLRQHKPRTRVVCKKVKASHTRYRALGPELIPVYRQSARRWLEAIHPAVGCHYFPPGLRLPSQPKSVTAHRPVLNYTAWWQRHMRVSSSPRAVTWKRTGRDSNPRLFASRANALPLSHTGHLCVPTLNVIYS